MGDKKETRESRYLFGEVLSLNYSLRSGDERRESPRRVLFHAQVDASNSKQSHSQADYPGPV